MQFTISIVAVMATLGFAAANPLLRFSEYGKGDKTCSPDNLISPTVSINDGFGACNQFPVGTSSIRSRLLEGSRTDCTVHLYTNNACNGPAISEYKPVINGNKCQKPIGAGWQSVKVTCP